MKTPFRLFTLALVLPRALPGAAADDPKPYTLFMGTDFAVPQNKEFYRVIDVTGGSFVIRVNNQETMIPMRNGSGNLKVDQALKLTAVTATLDHLKTERTYTEANDPYRKFNRDAGAVQGAAAAFDLNQMNFTAAVNRTGAANAAFNRAAGSPTQAAAQIEVDAATRASDSAMESLSDNAYTMSKADLNNPGLQALALQQELAEENFDAMRYSFEVSSPTPLNRPYVICIVRYHEKDAKPGTHQGTVIYAKSIEPIGERPAKINLVQPGLPVGFIVEECQVRLYNAGQEVATNAAPRRVPMTKDEAFLYLKIDRKGRAKGAPLPAAPALGRLDEETKSRLSLEQLRSPYYVQVSADGRPEAVFTDPACTHPADATVAEIVSAMRFYPALEQNKEQAGVAKLVFAQIPI